MAFRLSRSAFLASLLFIVSCADHSSMTQHSRDGSMRPRMDGALQLLRWQLQDENGRIPHDGMIQALQQVARMRDSVRAFGAGVDRTKWTWLGPGNIGGRTNALLIDPANPTTMLSGTAGGGMWRTKNGGASWEPVNDFAPTLSVTTMVADPSNFKTMYAGTGEGYGNGGALFGAGVFKSTDGGDTWRQIPSTNNADWPAVNSMTISADGKTLLATLTNAGSGGIMRSTDGAENWTRTSEAGDMGDISINPKDASQAIAGGLQNNVVYSTDGGVTWLESKGITATGRVSVAYAPSNPSIVYAVAADNKGSLFKSTDGGRNYVTVSPEAALLGSQGWIHNSIWVDPSDANTLAVGGLDWWRSRDGGASFTKISKWQSRIAGRTKESSHADEKGMISVPGFDGQSNKTVMVINDGGIFRTQDIYAVEESAGWEELNNNYGPTQFYGAAGNPTTGVLVAGAQDNGTVRYSGDAQKYTSLFGGDGGYCAADPTDPNVFYGQYTFLTIFRSANGGDWKGEYIYGKYSFWNGSAWEQRSLDKPITEAVSGSANFIAPFILDPNDPNRLLGGARSLWVTSNAKNPLENGGPAWDAIKEPVGTASGNLISAIAVAPGNSDIIYVGHNNGQIFRTNNGKASAPAWVRVGEGTLPSRFAMSITVDPKSSNTAYVMFGGFSPDNIWKTTDGGGTWSQAQGSGMTGVPALPVRSLAVNPNNSNWLYAGTEAGIFTSENGGQTWTVPQDGPSNASVRQLFFLKNTLYAVTFGRGIYKADLSTASGSSTATSATATIRCFHVTLEADPENAGGVLASAAPDCDQGTGYAAQTRLTLRARAGAGKTFQGWSDGASEAEREIEVTHDVALAAHFQPHANAPCYALNLGVDPPASGSITASPAPNCNGKYQAGTDVILSAHPAPGYLFGGWAGDADGIEEDTDVTIEGELTAAAVMGIAAPNDDVDRSVDLSRAFGSTFRGAYVTRLASNDADDPILCESGKSGKTVWFRFTPTRNGVLRIDTADSDYHTVVAAFTGTRGALRRIGCSHQAIDRSKATTRFDGDVVPSELAALVVPVAAGTNYVIEIGDATEPLEDEIEYTTGEEPAGPTGGLLQVTATFETTTRRRGVRP